MIYLVSNTPFYEDDVVNLAVCEIVFFKFSINLKMFDALIVTSKNSINSLKYNHVKSSDIEVFVIGEASKKACDSFGFNKTFLSSNSHSKEFINEIFPHLKNKKVLYIKAKKTVSNLDENLLKKNIDITSLVAYENRIIKSNLSPPPKNAKLIFTSPKNVRGFLKNFGWDQSYKAIAIGDTTALFLQNLTNPIISKEQSIKECINLAKRD